MNANKRSFRKRLPLTCKNSFVSRVNIVWRNPDLLKMFSVVLQINSDSKQSFSLIWLQDIEAVDVGRPGFEPWASAVIIKPTIYHCPRLMGGVGGTPLLMVIVLQPRSAMPAKQSKGISVCGAHLMACTYQL